MNSRTRLIGLAAGCGLLLAVFVLLAASPTQAGRTAPAVDRASLGNAIIHPTTSFTVTTVNISNEPPGYLIDHLYVQLGATASFFDALGYLKDHSNGVISEEFYHADGHGDARRGKAHLPAVGAATVAQLLRSCTAGEQR